MDPKVEETRGWKALCALVAKSNQSQFARRTGVPQPILSQLIRRQRKPGRKTALALAREGIKGEWWDQPARGRAA